MKAQKVFWPAPDTSYFADTQDVKAGQPIIFKNPTAALLFPFGQRSVTLTSANDLSGVVFTLSMGIYGITGINIPLNGPTAGNTVETPLKFITTIYSIIPDQDVEGVSVGTGTTGVVRPRFANRYDNFRDKTVSVTVDGTIDYTGLYSLKALNYIGNEPTINPPIIQDLGPSLVPIASNMINATTSQFAILPGAARTIAAFINSSTDGSLNFSVLQRGIRSR